MRSLFRVSQRLLYNKLLHKYAKSETFQFLSVFCIIGALARSFEYLRMASLVFQNGNQFKLKKNKKISSLTFKHVKIKRMLLYNIFTLQKTHLMQQLEFILLIYSKKHLLN